MEKQIKINGIYVGNLILNEFYIRTNNKNNVILKLFTRSKTEIKIDINKYLNFHKQNNIQEYYDENKEILFKIKLHEYYDIYYITSNVNLTLEYNEENIDKEILKYSIPKIKGLYFNFELKLGYEYGEEEYDDILKILYNKMLITNIIKKDYEYKTYIDEKNNIHHKIFFNGKKYNTIDEIFVKEKIHNISGFYTFIYDIDVDIL